MESEQEVKVEWGGRERLDNGRELGEQESWTVEIERNRKKTARDINKDTIAREPHQHC